MYQLSPLNCSTPMTIPTARTTTKFQRGITLIESLIAIVIAALGILGIVGVQMRTLTDTSTTVRRAQAIRLIEDLSERMKVNPNALANINAYVSGFSDSPTIISCSTGCNPAQQASYDIAIWKKTVQETLPLGQANVFIPDAESGLTAGERRQLGVMLAWRQNERADADASFKDSIDATKFQDGSTFKGLGGNAASCPDGFVCHVQYIPVVGRCAPHTPGSNSSLYYCPGA